MNDQPRKRLLRSTRRPHPRRGGRRDRQLSRRRPDPRPGGLRGRGAVRRPRDRGLPRAGGRDPQRRRLRLAGPGPAALRVAGRPRRPRRADRAPGPVLGRVRLVGRRLVVGRQPVARAADRRRGVAVRDAARPQSSLSAPARGRRSRRARRRGLDLARRLHRAHPAPRRERIGDGAGPRRLEPAAARRRDRRARDRGKRAPRFASRRWPHGRPRRDTARSSPGS